MLVCHDLKKEMEPVAPPLPASLRVIPVLFYAAAAGCAFFAAYFMIQKNAAVKDRVVQERITTTQTKKMVQIQVQYQKLEDDLNRAKSMIEWIRGSHSLQPLAVTIARSIDAGSNILELSLKRNNENPWQTQFSIQYNGNDSAQMEHTNGILNDEEGFRSFNPTITQNDESLAYSATLFKQ